MKVDLPMLFKTLANISTGQLYLRIRTDARSLPLSLAIGVVLALRADAGCRHALDPAIVAQRGTCIGFSSKALEQLLEFNARKDKAERRGRTLNRSSLLGECHACSRN